MISGVLKKSRCRRINHRLLLCSRWKAFTGGNRAPIGLSRKKLGYFEQNADLMRYAEFRLAGYFVGSGVVEAGCRTVIGQRLKRSGMFWSVRGANAIIAVRCCQISGRFEDFWAAAA